MKERQLRTFAVTCVFIMLFVVGLSYMADIFQYDVAGAYDCAMSGEAQAGKVEHGDYIYKKENEAKPQESMENVSESADDASARGESEPELAMRIIIPKLSDDIVAEFEDIYINRQIRLTLNNAPYGVYIKEMILYDTGVVKNVNIKDIRPRKQDSPAGTVITLELDGVYEYNLYEENNNYIIDMVDIHSVYDKVIVIDAGHGGGDNGCGSCDARHYEKEITLSVVKSLKEKLDATDIKVYYTRLKDETVYLRPRVTLANDVRADMFISIHCNYYDRYRWYKVDGAETLYSAYSKKMKNMNRQLADTMLDKFTGAVSIRKRSVINRKKDLFILKKSRVPSTIVEMGYMSDAGDLKHLTNEKKRKKVVDGLYNGIVEAYKEMYGKTVSFDGTKSY